MKKKMFIVMSLVGLLLLAGCYNKSQRLSVKMGSPLGNDDYEVTVTEAVLSDTPENLPEINQRDGLDKKIKFDKDGKLLDGRKYLILRLSAKNKKDKEVEISLPEAAMINGKDPSFKLALVSIPEVKDYNQVIKIKVPAKKETSLYMGYVIDQGSIKDFQNGNGLVNFEFIKPGILIKHTLDGMISLDKVEIR